MATTLSPGLLHHAIARRFVDEGVAPTCAELASHFGVDAAEMGDALRSLQRDHGVVLHPGSPEIWICHPFSAAPTGFVVRAGDERLWWGNCAWCSLGIAALLGGDEVTIQTTLGAEGEPVTLHLDAGHVREQHLWVHFPIPMQRAWDNVVYTCSTMLVFETEAAIEAWCQRHRIPRGSAQPVQRVYDLARVWYGRHLEADWRKWTTAEARRIFAALELTGPVWALPESDERF